MSLLETPPGTVVDLIKLFTESLAKKLKDEVYRNSVYLTWTMGGLHFSDTNEVFSNITNQANFLQAIPPITYIGRSTHVDCALGNMTLEIHNYQFNRRPKHFVVVVTDAMETGFHCGGMKKAAENAKDLGYQLFAVGVSRVRSNKQGLQQIASSPVALFNGDLVAVNLTSKEIIEATIDRIVQIMVSCERSV